MNSITMHRAQEISKLHEEIVGHFRSSLENAIRIGALLTDQKAELKHGEFESWITANLPFTGRTARNYMHIYRERDWIKTESVSDLNGAYKLIANPVGRLISGEVKKRQQAEKIAYAKEKIAYAKEHPEASPALGTVKYGKGGAGWDCKYTIEGKINGLPIIGCECIDPEYHRLKANAAPYEVVDRVHQAVMGMESALRALSKIKKEHGGVNDELFHLSWDEGVKYLKPQLEKAWSDLCRVVNKLNPQLTQDTPSKRYEEIRATL